MGRTGRNKTVDNTKRAVRKGRTGNVICDVTRLKVTKNLSLLIY